MHGTALTDIAMVVVAALIGGLGFARLKQPPILGYILAGVLLGPSGLKLIESREQVDILAELGVLLLLFVVGMELNLRTFKKFATISVITTLAQIFISLLVTVTLSNLFGWSLGLSVLLGFVTALSSTAVVVKMMESIGEMHSDKGQLSIGILIAQDLAIVPMILIIKNFENSFFGPILFVKIIAAVALIALLILYLGRRERVRVPLAHLMAGEKELTPLAGLTFCFAAAAISGLLDLSPAYGAFLAGLILGNTQERKVMLESTHPIQTLLLMMFFLSIGLLFDLSFIWEHLFVVTLLLVVITIGKTAVNIGILRTLRLPWSQAFLVGVVVAQLGEFAFLLTKVARDAHIINEFGEKLIISLTVLSLAFSPLWLTIARKLQMLADGNLMNAKSILNFLFGDQVSKVKAVIGKVKESAASPTMTPSTTASPTVENPTIEEESLDSVEEEKMSLADEDNELLEKDIEEKEKETSQPHA